MARELPGLGAYGVIRLMQDKGSRQHDAFEKAGGLEGFNRLHPVRSGSQRDLGRGREGQHVLAVAGLPYASGASPGSRARMGPKTLPGVAGPRSPRCACATKVEVEARDPVPGVAGAIEPIEPNEPGSLSNRTSPKPGKNSNRARLMCHVRQRTRNAFRVAQSAENSLEICRMLSWRCLKT